MHDNVKIKKIKNIQNEKFNKKEFMTLKIPFKL